MAAGEPTAPTFFVNFGASAHTSRGGMYWCQGASPAILSDTFVTVGEPARSAWRIEVGADAPERHVAAIIPLGDNRPGATDAFGSLDGASLVGLRLLGELGGRSLHVELITSRDADAAGIHLGNIAADALDASSWRAITLPLAQARAGSADAGATFLRISIDGHGPAWVALESLQLHQEETMAPSAAAAQLAVAKPVALRKALWVWKTRELLAEQPNYAPLLDLCRRQGITDLYFQIPYQYAGGTCTLERTDEQRAFNTLAAEQGITMHALDGNAKYVWAKNHPQMFALVDALADFNAGTGDAGRYRAVHLDNEPYVNAEWRDPETRKQLIRDYLALNRALKPRVHAANMAFGLDIPHWFETLDVAGNALHPDVSGNGPESILHLLMPLVDNLGIMSYRERVIGPNGVIACCLTEFALGKRYGVDVLAAVELGTGPDVEKGITLGCYSPKYAFDQIQTLQTAASQVEGCTGIAIHYYAPFRELERRL
ncbi:MAG: hypothetical protein H6817_05740 [Phycisphaerales bacterium]|nr:hypothetical protein [Phycisphaerales bacterium]